MAENTEQPENKKSKGGIVLWIFVILFLIGNIVQGILFTYPHFTQLPAVQDSLATKKQELAATLDTLSNIKEKLIQTQTDLAEKGIQNEELNSQIAELEATLKKAKRNEGWALGQLGKLKNDKKAYETMFRQMEQEIAQLKETTAQQDTMITELKVDKAALQDTIVELEEDVEYLEDEVDKGKTLVASDFKVTAVKSNGKEKFDENFEYKSKHLHQAKIEFTIAENKIADIEQKDIYVQIIDPSGTTIYDLQQGGGEMEVEGKALFYTIKQAINYDRQTQRMTVMYKKNADYSEGAHKVNVFADGRSIGSGKFIVD